MTTTTNQSISQVKTKRNDLAVAHPGLVDELADVDTRREKVICIIVYHSNRQNCYFTHMVENFNTSGNSGAYGRYVWKTEYM